MFDLGSVYPAALDVYDDTGTLADPAAATLTITRPDGTPADTSGLQIPPAETGKLRLAYTTEQTGRHTVRWATQDPDTAYTDVFDVAPAVSPAIVSLADAKAQLNIDPDDTSDDDELRSYIEALTGVVENNMHEVIVPRQFTDDPQRMFRARSFRLWHAPVLSLVSVATWDGSKSWDVANLHVSSSGVVRVLAGEPFSGDIVPTYQAGMNPIPHRYQMGALVILAHVWETQRGQGTVMSGVIGEEEYRREPGTWFTIPNKALEWLGPPRPVVA
jgi:hypothetical protein